ncbi:hypothetical protein Anas_13590 [Armadillidium nasatum]|uniref:Uncharacterized protein n=1 Tax=Armadillidium nasatum TaxID=96803 RepID=A0A5N5T075_9CRUS|nr:hypothetical protein Anas_13590 [Armadillidium nasatum]
MFRKKWILSFKIRHQIKRWRKTSSSYSQPSGL